MRAEWSYRTDFKGHRERVAWHKELKGRDNFKADSEGRREPAVRMNTEGKGKPLARAATERIAMPAITENKWPPGSFLDISV